MDLKGKRVLVTGGSGFLGQRIVELLERKGAIVFVPRSKQFDLVDYRAARRCFRTVMPHIVIHSAALYGGLGINYKIPARIFFKNIVMGANVFEMCRFWDVRKLVFIGTACSYPDRITRPMKEEDFWAGALHSSVQHYGGVKKVFQIAGVAYKKQYDLDSSHIVLANLYGEGDSYNPERSHVVAALIRKFVEAKRFGEKKVVVWGTGSSKREFLYVGDAAEAIVLATEKYDSQEPLNIGTGIATSIRELVELIVKITGYNGKVIWDDSKPDGQAVKVFDVSKMKKLLDWYPKTTLEEGLQKTISWFESNYETAIQKW